MLSLAHFFDMFTDIKIGPRLPLPPRSQSQNNRKSQKRIQRDGGRMHGSDWLFWGEEGAG